MGNSAAKKRKKFVSQAHQQYGAQRGKSPGRKVKVTDVITPPAAQTAEPDVQREIPAEWKFLAVGYNTGSYPLALFFCQFFLFVFKVILEFTVHI